MTASCTAAIAVLSPTFSATSLSRTRTIRSMSRLASSWLRAPLRARDVPVEQRLAQDPVVACDRAHHAPRLVLVGGEDARRHAVARLDVGPAHRLLALAEQAEEQHRDRHHRHDHDQDEEQA